MIRCLQLKSIIYFNQFEHYLINSVFSQYNFTAAVTQWLEHPPCKWEVVGSIHGRVKPKTLKLELPRLALSIKRIELGLVRLVS